MDSPWVPVLRAAGRAFLLFLLVSPACSSSSPPGTKLTGAACKNSEQCESFVCADAGDGLRCQAPACGDGVTQSGETCDDGNLDNSDTCPDDVANGGTCQTAVCGDGFVLAGTEACDDGNRDNTDSCPDDSANGGTCQAAVCGDGFVLAGTEQCDDGNQDNTDACLDDTAAGGSCVPAACGDGFVQSGVEECDDGNLDNTDGCPDDAVAGGGCVIATCGDGFVYAGMEVCDDGNQDNFDGCPDDPTGLTVGTCIPATCGDGFVNSSTESCDSGVPNECPDERSGNVLETCQSLFCGGDPITPPTMPVAPAVVDAADAARFLTQATFGPTRSEIARVLSMGFSAWLDEQFNAPLTSHVARVGCDIPPAAQRQEAFFYGAVQAPDQLRQRVAYALGELFVISDVDLTGDERTIGMARFHDLLAEGAFGSFEQLLRGVTLNPLMGEYQGMLRSQVADGLQGIAPDQGFARELMQSFTLGTLELNQDGTLTGGPPGTRVFSEADVENIARALTGWNYAGSQSWLSTNRDYYNAMEPNEAFHDTGAKSFLGEALSAGMTAEGDVDRVMGRLGNHPNVAPFVSSHLIQRLVTSNPTPAYVGRVAQLFESDENGQRGNLAAVIRAILLDSEARTGHMDMAIPEFGKVREPLLKLTALWRAFGASATTGRYDYPNPEWDLGTAFQRAPTVEGFHRRDHAPAALAAASLVAPELQGWTEATAVSASNKWFDVAFEPSAMGSSIVLDLSVEAGLASQPASLVADLALLLTGDQMSSGMRTVVETLVTNTPMSGTGIERVREALFLIANSPEFSTQR